MFKTRLAILHSTMQHSMVTGNDFPTVKLVVI